jgi:hypothetical protein
MLRSFENRVVMSISEPKTQEVVVRLRKSLIEQVRKLYFSPHKITAIDSNTLDGRGM